MAFLTPTESMFQTNYETTQFPSSSCSPLDFNGGASEFMMRRSVSYSGMDRAEEMQPDEESDDGLQLGEKKRRLNVEQVRALEKSFELGNKLEPDRKMGLARALGLNPRQVSIWFQNRRARVKTKQLERDYDILKRQYDALKANNDSLKSQNNRLEAEIMALESKESRGQINLNRDNEGSWNDGSELSCDVKLNTTSINHTMYHHHPSNKHTAPFSSGIVPSSDSGSITQLLNNSSVPTNDGFYNMFGGIEENSELWPWHQQ